MESESHLLQYHLFFYLTTPHTTKHARRPPYPLRGRPPSSIILMMMNNAPPDAKSPRWRRRSAGREREAIGRTAVGHLGRACGASGKCKKINPILHAFFLLIVMSFLHTNPGPGPGTLMVIRTNARQRWQDSPRRGRRQLSCRPTSRRTARATRSRSRRSAGP